ncbi:flagellar biosynthesis anti-sigma factor FlgM [Vibrio parahaemolyticus]
MEKVRQLKEAYQSGQYKGDSAVVSQRLVDEALGGF